MSRFPGVPQSVVLMLALSACEPTSLPLQPVEPDGRALDSGGADFDIARISYELCGDGVDNDGDGVIDEDCGACDTFVTRRVAWWADRLCVIRGEANDVSVAPVTLGSSEIYSTGAEIRTALAGSDFSGHGRLQRQLLVTVLNAEHFGLWDVEVVDWDEDGTGETVAWLWDQANAAYDGGSDYTQRFWASQLQEITRAGVGAGLWFDDSCALDPEHCDGLDNDGDGVVDEDCSCTEVCDGYDNDDNGLVDDGLDCPTSDALQCESPTDCLTLAEAHGLGILDVTSTGFGEEVVVTNSSETYSVCIDQQAVYYSDATQPFFWDVGVIDAPTELAPGEAWSSWFGSWTTANDGYAPYLGEPAWWCLQFTEEIDPDATFDFPGAVVPDVLGDFVLPGNDSDGDSVDDLLDWVNYAGVQAQHDLWEWQDEQPVLILGKTAAQSDCAVDVTLALLNAGVPVGTGTVTDTVMAGWSAIDITPTPDSATVEVDGSITLTWDLTVPGIEFGTVYSETVTYSLIYDVGLDLGRVDLPLATVDFDDGVTARTSTSTAPVLFDLDLDCDLGVDCPSDEECDGVDNDHDGDVDEGFADSDGDGVADCVDSGEEEVCDGLDNDGDGEIDEGFDSDGDGVADCFDSEECDGLDNDGDGSVDEGFDSDGDGVADCFDSEECDGLDNDGDGEIDEGVTSTFYADADGDGFGDADSTTEACSVPWDHTTDTSDCDDTLYRTNPDALELCDGQDDDCDGVVDDDCYDTVLVGDPSGEPVDVVDSPGACARIGETSDVGNPHHIANLGSYMSALQGDLGTLYDRTDELSPVMDWSSYCLREDSYDGADGNYDSTIAWPSFASRGTRGAARFRGYLNIPEGASLDRTVGLIGNDSLDLVIEGTEVAWVNWDDGQWKKFRWVSFPRPGVYAFEVRWANNMECELDAFELVWGDSYIDGYGEYDDMCDRYACVYADLWEIPGLQPVIGDELLSAQDGSATDCTQCDTDDDCLGASGGTCNSAGVCE